MTLKAAIVSRLTSKPEKLEIVDEISSVPTPVVPPPSLLLLLLLSTRTPYKSFIFICFKRRKSSLDFKLGKCSTAIVCKVVLSDLHTLFKSLDDTLHQSMAVRYRKKTVHSAQ